MEDPYFTITRRFLDSDMWTGEPFTRGQAWVDLIGKANFSDGFIRVRGIKVEVPRGTNSMSLLKLAKRWCWSRGKVRRFLNELEMAHQIEQQKTNITTLIKIINYDEYQLGGTPKRTPNGHQTDTKRTPTIIIEKNEKNEKKENITPHTPLPTWLDKKLWAEFLKMRVSIKKPVKSQIAVTRLLNALKKLIDEGHEQTELIGLAIEKCWQSFYAPKDNVIPYGKKPTGQDFHEALVESGRRFLENDTI